MKIYLGADHRGFKLKGEVIEWLKEWRMDFTDLGAYEFNKKDDYPLYAEKVGVIVGENENARGIIMCGSGVGVDVVSNKIDGVRASIGKSVGQVKAGRNDDDMNVLVLAADFTKKEEVKKMIKVFMQTKFSGKARHKRRLEEIRRIEENN